MTAATAPRPPETAERRVGHRIDDEVETRDQWGVRLVCFAGLAAWGAAHWAGLVKDADLVRAAGEVAVATAGAALLILLARSSFAAPLRHVLAGAIGALTVVVGLVVAGLPAGLLRPARWDELGDGLDRGLSGIRTIDWPYGGDDDWIRLVVLLGAPLLLGLAATVAFWPARRAGTVLRAGGLVLLLLLYGTAVTEHDPGAPLPRGLVLLALVAAWLWLPRLRIREAAPGAVLVLAVGIVALPVAARLDAERPWWDYREWNWFGGGKVVAFDWNHSYGPLDWPRNGTTLLNIRADRAHYWKAETLDFFDGRRWVHSDRNTFSRVTSELPERLNPRWDERIEVSVRALRSEFVIGAGTTYLVIGLDSVVTSGDGTTRILERPLERGDSYVVRAYAPNPSAADMRAAGEYGSALAQYTQLRVPAPQGAPPRDITMPLPGLPDTATAGGNAALLRSPYARVYRLARRLTAGAPTVYDAVKNVERHLQENYTYSERVPAREIPLAAFLFQDQRGYCQQFSGAMALMLRMAGIPARVSGGFSPGSYNADTREWRVRDFDAHSWVEVNFPEIGWVPFDPTPTAAPAESQSAGADATSAARADAAEARIGASPLADRGPEPGSGPSDGGDNTLELWMIPLVLAAAALAWVALALALDWRDRRRLAPGERVDAQLRELLAALRRLGWPLEAGTTLLALERRLHRAAGPASAGYVAGIRAHRFAPGTPPPPGRTDRRALRRELAGHGGVLGRLRGYLALPPLGPRRGRNS